MIGKISLQNFRNHTRRAFVFSNGATLIVGPNGSGKTNILEAIYLLASGKSFRAEGASEIIHTEKEFCRVTGETGETNLELFQKTGDGWGRKYLVNGVARRQSDFVGKLRAVIFSPADIEIVADSPSTRRRYLDAVLSQVHKDYRAALHVYEKALRTRNKLLLRIRDEGWSREQLGYWDSLLIQNGKIIHDRRREFLEFVNNEPSEFFPITLSYDHSIISAERLKKYTMEEVAAATTLVGPHRDDFKTHGRMGELKLYASRGEQRMGVFTLKLAELAYIILQTGERPVLLLDDIFSELDPDNRHRLLSIVPKQQTIMTTTDLHLVDRRYLAQAEVIDLENKSQGK